jgi:protein phosphatase
MTEAGASGSPIERVRWRGCTHPGRFRKQNQDAFLALALNRQEVLHLGKVGEAPVATQDFIFAVSDGMGGAKAGEFASRIAVDRITRLFPRSFETGALGFGRDFQNILLELFDGIHREMLHLSETYEECRGMGATLTLCWVTPEWAYFAHLGDSRLYYCGSAGDLRQVTHDHTHAGWLRRQGKINEREERSHPTGHQLQQVLGGGVHRIETQVGAIGLEVGDRFLLCSDGLILGHWDRGLAEYLGGADFAEEDLAEKLVAQANRVSGRDNTTALLFEVRAGDLPEEDAAREPSA